MNRLELAEYVTREFLNSDAKPVDIEETGEPLQCVIVYDDGKRQICNGLIAQQLMRASDA